MSLYLSIVRSCVAVDCLCCQMTGVHINVDVLKKSYFVMNSFGMELVVLVVHV